MKRISRTFENYERGKAVKKIAKRKRGPGIRMFARNIKYIFSFRK